MGLETGSYVADLVVTNPTGSDPKQQGDNHLRLLKTALRNCFAGFTGAIFVTGTDGGAVNAYTLTPATTLPAYGTKMEVVFAPTITNTGACTLNISGLGVKDLKSVSGAALVAGDLVATSVYAAFYNGTEFRLLAPTKNYIDQVAMSAALPAQSLGFLRSDGAASAFTTTHTGYAVNEVKGADIASSATINLTTATGNLVHVTGTTTITAITIPSGAERVVVFDGALTLTHNATTLILPTGANMLTAAGDVAVVRGDGSGNARVVSYSRANGTPLAGSLVLLATLTPTAAANVDFLSTFSSAYDNYLIIGQGITSNTGTNDTMSIRLAVAGAADSGSNYIAISEGASASTTATAYDSDAVTGLNGIGMNFEMSIKNVNSATGTKSISVRSEGAVSATDYLKTDTAAAYKALNAVTGFRLYWTGGANFAATGKVRVYGIQNA